MPKKIEIKDKRNLTDFDDWIRDQLKYDDFETTMHNIKRPAQFYCIELIEHWIYDHDKQEFTAYPTSSEHEKECVLKCFTQIKDVNKCVEAAIIKFINEYYLLSDNVYELRIFYPCPMGNSNGELNINRVAYRLFLSAKQTITNRELFMKDVYATIAEACKETQTNELYKVSTYNKGKI